MVTTHVISHMVICKLAFQTLDSAYSLLLYLAYRSSEVLYLLGSYGEVWRQNNHSHSIHTP